MVAVQVLLMNYFLLGLHSDKHLTNDVLPPIPLGDCPLGCKLCSPMNGCLSCKPPFVLVLPTETITQRATCKRDCPKGYFNSYSGSSGFCVSKIQMKECKRCTYRTHCLPCRPGRLKGKCHRKCSKGSYFDNICNSCLQKVHSGPSLSIGQNKNLTSVGVHSHSPSKAGVVTSNKVTKPLTKEEKKKLKAQRRRRRRRKRKRNRNKKKRRRHKDGKRGRKRDRKRDRKRHRVRHWKRRKRKRKLSFIKKSAYNYTSSLT